ncbi:DnaJ domain-containing protein [Cephalotus follicularis]|uniref:DnaJ domain-containing protein n=1 Tax=Cephalotus follicularis TaxID=3775 RepID=A0A1Q3B240_CEPFO|nr:DnaJ domain-containing protein [Cephalotus follicularis]
MEAADQQSPSYYSILGVSADSSDEVIRRAYRRLAMQWHPDKWTRTPSRLGQAKRKFQQIQEAYSVLSDEGKRRMYDAGLYDPNDDDEVEGFSDFVQEMVSLMAQTRREDKSYSIEELQSMLTEIAQGCESTPLYCGGSHYMYNIDQGHDVINIK